MTKDGMTRRAFLAATTVTSMVAATGCRVNVASWLTSPNERLRVAGIGVGGMGVNDICNCRSEEVVALCDVDDKRAAEAYYRFPKAQHFADYRVMLETLGDSLDAVTISTPDHTHAPAACMALETGLHVRLQKPLTHTIAEARHITRVAAEKGVVTQMGNQGHSSDSLRELCELVWAGTIGDVHTVHAWTTHPVWPQAIAQPYFAEPVPDHLHWDLWLGPAPTREYNHLYAPFQWRGWWDFGNGALGDMGCHIMDPVFCALKLAEADHFTCEVVESYGMNEQTAPRGTVVRYSFPARAGMGPVELYWHDGRDEHGRWLQPPRPEGVPEEETLGDGKHGSYFVGTKGICTAGTYGGGVRLLPAARMAGFRPPEPTLDRVPGEDHTRDWLNAIREGRKASSDFSYAGPLTEFVQFGRVALFAGKKVEYDFKRGEITNDRALDALLTKQYREGWALPC